MYIYYLPCRHFPSACRQAFPSCYYAINLFRLKIMHSDIQLTYVYLIHFLCISGHDEINNLLFLHTVQNRFSMNRNGLLRPEKKEKAETYSKAHSPWYLN